MNMIATITRRVGPVLAAALLALASSPAVASPPRAEIIVLPGATSAEGIATGRGGTFYAGDLYRGDIFRGDLRRGTARLFIDAPEGRGASGLKADVRHGLLFVAGGANGEAYVYDTVSGQTLASYRFAPAGVVSYVNDVALTPDGAWFTDSFRAELYFVPVDRSGHPGAFRSLELFGPAGDTSAAFNLNGIEATPGGRTLIVAHYGNGTLATVDPDTGASATITGVSVPGGRNPAPGPPALGRPGLPEPRLGAAPQRSDLSSGAVEDMITSELFHVPTTVALHGDQLAVVNSHFDTGVPPTADQYEIVLIHR